MLVALILDKEKLFPDNWIYIHTPDVKVGRIQNFNNWSAALVPEPGRTCLGMEYFCFPGRRPLGRATTQRSSLWRRKELAQLGLAPGAAVLDGSVVRVPEAYPIYDATYRAHLDDRSRASSIRSRTCTPSAATACTSTTIRITRCMPRC